MVATMKIDATKFRANSMNRNGDSVERLRCWQGGDGLNQGGHLRVAVYDDHIGDKRRSNDRWRLGACDAQNQVRPVVVDGRGTYSPQNLATSEQLHVSGQSRAPQSHWPHTQREDIKLTALDAADGIKPTAKYLRNFIGSSFARPVLENIHFILWSAHYNSDHICIRS